MTSRSMAGAFDNIHPVLSQDEASRMVDMAERMGFEESGTSGGSAGRSSRAVTWCLHEHLAEQLIKRMVPFTLELGRWVSEWPEPRLS